MLVLTNQSFYGTVDNHAAQGVVVTYITCMQYLIIFSTSYLSYVGKRRAHCCWSLGFL